MDPNKGTIIRLVIVILPEIVQELQTTMELLTHITNTRSCTDTSTYPQIILSRWDASFIFLFWPPKIILNVGKEVLGWKTTFHCSVVKPQDDSPEKLKVQFRKASFYKTITMEGRASVRMMSKLSRMSEKGKVFVEKERDFFFFMEDRGRAGGLAEGCMDTVSRRGG